MPREGTWKWKERNRSAGRWNVGWQKPPFVRAQEERKPFVCAPFRNTSLPTYSFPPTNWLTTYLPTYSTPLVTPTPSLASHVCSRRRWRLPSVPSLPRVVRFFSLAQETKRSQNFASAIFAETHSLKQALSTHPQSERFVESSPVFGATILGPCLYVCVRVFFFFLVSWLSLAFFISVYKLNRISFRILFFLLCFSRRSDSSLPPLLEGFQGFCCSLLLSLFASFSSAPISFVFWFGSSFCSFFLRAYSFRGQCCCCGWRWC